MNNYAGPTSTRPTRTTFSHINARKSCVMGWVVSGTQDHITGARNAKSKRLRAIKPVTCGNLLGWMPVKLYRHIMIIPY